MLDLSRTEWPELPNAEVVGASVYQARGRLNGYPDPEAVQVRRALAERHNIRSSQIVFGNGAAELIRSAVYLLASEGDEVVVPRPSRPRYATIVSRAGARLVQPGLPGGMLDAEAVLAAVGPRTRVRDPLQPRRSDGHVRSCGAHRRPGRAPAGARAHRRRRVVRAVPGRRAGGLRDVAGRGLSATARAALLLEDLRPVRASGRATRSAPRQPRPSCRRSRRRSGVNALTQATVLQALKVGDPDIAPPPRNRDRAARAAAGGALHDGGHGARQPGELPLDPRARGARRGSRGATRELPRAGGGRRAARRRRLRARRDSRPPCGGPAAVGVARGAAAAPRWKHPPNEGGLRSDRGPRAWRCWAAAEATRSPAARRSSTSRSGTCCRSPVTFDSFGKPSQRAADVAAEEIRKAAAKAGARHTVKLQNVDYKSEPKVAVELAKKLVKNGATCLTGAFGSGHAARVGAKVGTPNRTLVITSVGKRDAAVRCQGQGLPEPGRAPGPPAGRRACRVHVTRAEGRRPGQDRQHRGAGVDLRQGR